MVIDHTRGEALRLHGGAWKLVFWELHGNTLRKTKVSDLRSRRFSTVLVDGRLR
jgi:hypothetical protein